MPRALLVPLVLLVLALSPAQAQQKTDGREALLAEMFEILQLDAMFKPMVAQLRQAFEQRLRQADPTISDQDLSAVGDVVEEELNAVLKPVVQMSAQVMLKYFNEDDMRAMLAFYKTPTGQKAIRVMPQMMNDLMIQQQQYLAQIGPHLIARIEEALRKKGYDI